jgi:DNA-binding response OmpR family regulator
MSARILIVEDDAALRATLEAAVSFGGFAHEAAPSGAAAVACVEAGGFDAVLLDLGLPDCDGADLLGRLRRLSNLPIIIVSGRGSEADKIAALDLGADDYVAKPFLPGELLARIRAALRRHYVAHGALASALAEPLPSDRRPLRLGALVLDPFDRSAALGGTSVQFNEAEFRVLHALAARPGETVSRADILETLHGDTSAGETNLVDVYVSRIRSKLRTLPGGEDLIATVRGEGWRLRSPE